MNEFIINEYISLRLEENKTVIYVNGEEFNQCKYILLNRKIDELEDLLALESIDELVGSLDHFLEIHPYTKGISPETEFWVHCSNLQIWAENNYDTRLLHCNLAFPLLKKLVDAGDKKALMVFKEEIARRLESKYPSVVGYLVKENYIDYLPFDYVIDIIVNRELSNAVISQGYEFDFTLYLESIGEKYTHIIKNAIIKVIRDHRLDDLIYIKQIGLLNNLKKEDLVYLIERPEIDLVGMLFEALKDSEKYDYYYQDGFFFHKRVIDHANHLISKKLVEIIKINNRDENSAFIRLGLLMYVNYDDLTSVIQDSESDIIEMVLDLNKEELFDWFHQFFNRIGEMSSSPIKNYIHRIIKDNNSTDLIYILEESLLDNLNQEDLIYLIEDPDILFIENIVTISGDLDTKESFFLYGSPFNEKLLNYGCKSLKKKIIEIIEKNDENDIRAIIRLRLINCLSKVELESLLHRPEINFLEYFLKVKTYEFEDIKEWSHTFLKEMGESMSGSVRNIIVNYVNKDNLEDLSFFFDFEVINYLKEKEKKELYNFLKTNEDRYQKKGNPLEREYFNKILGKISDKSN